MKTIVILVLISSAFCTKVKEQCGPYEEYKRCGTACPKTCDTLGAEVKCVALCISGCFCVDGYVRNTDTQECVLPSDCPSETTTEDTTTTTAVTTTIPVTPTYTTPTVETPAPSC